MGVGIGGEGLWLCPTIDNAAAGTAAATNFGSAGAFTFAGSMTGSHWETNTGSGGSRVLNMASNRHITVASNPVVAYPWSLAVWLYPNTNPSGFENTFFSHQNTDALGLRFLTIGLVSSVIRVRLYAGSYANFTSAAITLNAWNHVVFRSQNSGACDCYINSVLAGTNAGSFVPGSTPAIGTRTDSATDCWKGLIDDFRLFPSLLSTREISWLYRNRAIQGPPNWKPGVP